jgi:hypothetical protein
MSEYPNITLEASGVVNVPGELRQKERITTHIFTFAADASKYVATEIANLIRTSPKPHVVLGLATGSTPTGMFKRWPNPDIFHLFLSCNNLIYLIHVIKLMGKRSIIATNASK